MQKRTFLFLMVVGLLICGYTSAQVKIGDNPQTIDPASVLELESSERVLVITRVDSLQMAAITPSRGALVYNTSADCIFYYDGTAWNNLCEGGGGGAGGVVGFTTDPIANALSTIVITPTESGSNIEIAPNSINSEQIINGGINGIDIQNTSIGRGKLQDNSVDKSALAENSVGPFAIDNDSVDLADFNNRTGFIRGGELISEDEGNVLLSGSDGRVFYNNSELQTAVEANTIANTQDEDSNPLNEIQNLVYNSDTRTISLSQSTATVTLPAGTDEVDGNNTNELTDISYDTITKVLSLTRSATPTGSSVDLSSLAGGGVGGGEDNQNLGLAVLDTISNVLTINIENGNAASVNLSPLIIGGDGGSDDLTAAAVDFVPYLTIDSTNTQAAVQELKDELNALELAGGGSNNSDMLIENDSIVVVDGAGRKGILIADIPLSDFGAATESISMGDLRIFNLADPVDADDAATKKYVDSLAATSSEGGLNRVMANQSTFVGDGTTTDTLDIAVGGVSEDMIEEGAITILKLNQMGAENNEVLQWSDADNAWATNLVTASAKLIDEDIDDALAVQADSTGYNITTDNSTIFIDSDSLKISDGAITLPKLNQMGAENNEVLQWSDADNAWATNLVTASAKLIDEDIDDALAVQADSTGYNITTDNSTIFIDSDSLKISDGAITLPKLNQMGAENNEVLQWSDADNAWATNLVTASAKLIDEDIDDALAVQADSTGYNITTDNNTIFIDSDSLKISDGAITLPKLNQMGAENNEVLQWSDADNAWATNLVTASAKLIDEDIDDALAVQADSTGYNITTDNNTIFIDSDSLKISDGAITLPKLNQMGAENNEVLQWSDADNAWATNLVTASAKLIDEDIDDALTVQADSTGYNITTDNNTIFIDSDSLKISDGAITLSKLNRMGAEDNEVLLWSNLEESWITRTVNGSELKGLPGGIFFASTADSTAIENSSQFFWDNANETLNIGLQFVNNVDQKLNVNGVMRTTGIKVSNGTEGVPAYRFTNNGDTGMFLADPSGVLAFSANNKEAIRIDSTQNMGIGPNFDTNAIGARLHVDGDVRAEGAFFSNTEEIQPIPDYVFQNYFSGSSEHKADYSFKTLEEIESFVKKHYHLPGIKSAAEVKRDGFWNLSESNIQNLEKIEELFLHTIEQEKKIKELQSEKETLSEELQSLRKDLNEIKAMLKKSK